MADEADICRANLWLRTADRVLRAAGTFRGHRLRPAFRRTLRLALGRMDSGRRRVSRSGPLGQVAAFQRAGLPENRQEGGRRAAQGGLRRRVVRRDRTEIFASKSPCWTTRPRSRIDTSGPGLHKRGYRPLTGKAPLKETMAAAMILLSVWRPERPLVDPFCGSGTIPIEAALIGRNIAPGLQPHVRGRGVAAAAGRRCGKRPGRRPASAAKPDLPERIIGTDVDEGALQPGPLSCREGRRGGRHPFPAAVIRRADQQAALRLRDLQSALRRADGPVGRGPGPAPRHARRLPPPEDLVVLHPHGPPDFEAVIGQSADRRRKLYNGRIECTYYQFFGPKPGAAAGIAGESRSSERTRSKRRGEIDSRHLAADCRVGASRDSQPIRCSLHATARTAPPASAARSLLPAGLRRSLGQGAASRPKSSAPGWRSGRGTCAAGRRSWASPAIGSTNTTSPRCRWWSIATRTACTSPSSTGRTTTRRPSMPTGSI